MVFESGENIVGLIPDKDYVPEKPPMYRSKFPGEVDPDTFELGAKKSSHVTFGLGNGLCKPKADAFLKSHAKEPVLAEPGPVAVPKEKVKPPVPGRGSKPTMGLQSSKNFVTSNAVENILAVPKRDPEPINWLQKPHFGEVPPYLLKIKQEINDEYEYIRAMQQQQQDDTPAGMRLLPEQERQGLVNSLKAKWQDVNKAYQSTSVLSLASLDTIGKVKRKEQYEAQLAQIEKDIEKLSKKQVYVAELVDY